MRRKAKLQIRRSDTVNISLLCFMRSPTHPTQNTLLWRPAHNNQNKQFCRLNCSQYKRSSIASSQSIRSALAQISRSKYRFYRLKQSIVLLTNETCSCVCVCMRIQMRSFWARLVVSRRMQENQIRDSTHRHLLGVVLHMCVEAVSFAAKKQVCNSLRMEGQHNNKLYAAAGVCGGASSVLCSFSPVSFGVFLLFYFCAGQNVTKKGTWLTNDNWNNKQFMRILRNERNVYAECKWNRYAFFDGRRSC